jgi:serine/threonine protein kinase
LGITDDTRPWFDPDPPADVGFEKRIRQFEEDWSIGRRPTIDDYIADCDTSPTGLLGELAHIDLEFRIKAGEAARAADYFSRYPQLADDPAFAAGLIAEEFELRRRSDPTLTFEALAASYPQYQKQLREHMARLPTTPADRSPRSTSPHASPSAPGYEILTPLGAGGMGVVYKARDKRLGRVVALKFLPHEYAHDPARLALFHREARTASALNHPHICTVHDLGECDGRPFIVLEFVEGQTLRNMIGSRVVVDEVTRLVGEAARALAVAHAAGIVHRDIKPENLMVRPDGYLKVVDFGLAHRLPDSAQPGSTLHGVEPENVIGTIPYMSPEQARGKLLGAASDVFSLGVVLYELVTGRHPFSGEYPFDILREIVESTPVAASELNPEVPGSLDVLLARMLEKDPANRPSAAEVDAALSALALTPSPAPAVAPRPRSCTVGRRSERAELVNALTSAASGSGEMVCVVGESGIGKTTLVDEFLADMTSAPAAPHIARGRCSEWLAGAEAYLPVLDAIDSLLRGPTGSTAARYLRTLAPSWFAELGATSAQATRSDDGAPAATQTRLKRELIAFLTELSRRAPVVLFVDDIHWADLPTADLLAYLGRHCPGMRLLILVAYRRDELLLANHPFIPVKRDLQGRGVCRELALQLLDSADVERYLDLAFPRHAFPPDLVTTIHARTGGNPLFVAELTRFLRDREVIVLREARWVLARPIPEAVAEMPESVRGLIQRKLDQLGPADRALLGVGAVQGEEFESSVLGRALGEDLAHIEERLQELEQVHGLVRLVREHEFPNRTVSRRYGFVHAVYRDALSAELTPTRRAGVSRALADALFALQSGQPGLAAAELALLYETGREFLRAAGLFHVAAQNAARVFAHREAVTLARRGLGLLRGLPDSLERATQEFALRMTLGLQLQLTEGFAAPEVEMVYTLAREVREQHPAVGSLFPIVWGLWLFHKARSDLHRAQQMAAELLTLAEQGDDPALVLQARQANTIVALCVGEPTAARLHMEAAVRLYDPARHRNLTFQFGQDPGVACLAFGAVALWLLGESHEAEVRSRQAVLLAREASQPSTLSLALHFAAMLHQLQGDQFGVRELSSESLTLAVEHRFAFWQAGATVMLGWAAAASGEAEGASVVERGIDAWRLTGTATYQGYSLTLLADAYRLHGRTSEALQALDDADRVMTETGERLYESEASRLRGELLSGEMPAAAEAAFRAAIAIAQSQRARALQLRAALSLCRFLRVQGRAEEASAVVAAVVGECGEALETRELIAATDILGIRRK